MRANAFCGVSAAPLGAIALLQLGRHEPLAWDVPNEPETVRRFRRQRYSQLLVGSTVCSALPFWYVLSVFAPESLSPRHRRPIFSWVSSAHSVVSQLPVSYLKERDQ